MGCGTQALARRLQGLYDCQRLCSPAVLRRCWRRTAMRRGTRRACMRAPAWHLRPKGLHV